LKPKYRYLQDRKKKKGEEEKRKKKKKKKRKIPGEVWRALDKGLVPPLVQKKKIAIGKKGRGPLGPGLD